MPRKSFNAGMEAGAKPFEEKFKKQADAIEKVGSRIDSRLDEISGVMDVMMDDLSAQERKRIYDLNTIVDISELDDTEKEYLCSIVYAIANLNSELTQEQKDYLRSLKSYLKIVNVQTDVNIASIENIDNITTQKAIMQTIMEFLFLEYGNHDYMDDYADIFDYFSVNRKGVREIQDGIDAMYETVGIEGLAEHYGSTKKVTVVQGDGLSKADLDLRAKAEAAYFKYDIKSAFPLFNLLFEQGDGRSCYFLAQIYEYGYQGVVSVDKIQAKKYIEQGISSGDILCTLMSAEYNENSDLVYADIFEALSALAEGDDVLAMYELARLYDFAYQKIQDTAKAEYWYTLAVEHGFWGAMIGLANIYYLQKKYAKAFPLYQSVYENGNKTAAANLAKCYLNGFGINKDNLLAHKLFLEAANSGDVYSQEYIGTNELKKGNYNEAKHWLELAVAGGSKSSYYNLAKAIERCGGNQISLTIEGKQYDIRDYCLTMTYYLILGAMENDENAMVELLSNTLPRWWWIMYKQGKFEDWDNCLLIHNNEYDLSKFNLQDNTWHNSFTKGNWEIVAQYEQAGNAAASYYLGMEYVNQFSIFKRRSDRDAAVTYLTKARSNGITANIDEALKKLRIGKAFTWPYPKKFVV